MTHEIYMRRCLELAEKGLGKTYPNPVVGSVIVHRNEIIGEGYHEKAGENHAEVNAINSVVNKDLLKNSTIYVSLEPCSHFGRTPPCANKIVEMGIPRVVIGTLDLHEKVHGNGKRILEKAGTEVISGVLERECLEVNRRFFTFHTKNRPFVILKWAQSGDGFIDKNFGPVQISNPLTKQFVHQLRSEENAILIGNGTAIADDPSLTVREVSGRNPVRILIDMDLKVPRTSKIYNTEAPTLVFNKEKNDAEGNIKFIQTNRTDFLSRLMENLHRENIQSVIIEGGNYTLQQFTNENLWDEAIVIKNENLILKNGTKAPIFEQRPENITELRDNQVEFYKNGACLNF